MPSLNAEDELRCGCIALKLTHLTGLHGTIYRFAFIQMSSESMIGVLQLTHKLTDRSHPAAMP
jgi:hypothetical protein